MKVHVLTSCTGEKAVLHHRMLQMEDFQRGVKHVQSREAELESCLRTAEEMYTGQQHVRLMQGVKEARREGATVQVKVLSAGYGLIDGDRKIAPYNATFNDMRPREFREWTQKLAVAEQVARYLARPADLTLILLGDRYLDASALAEVEVLGGRTIAFCGRSSVSRFAPAIETIAFEQSDTTRFGSNMIGLKGELAKRLLAKVSDPQSWSLEGLLGRAPLLDPNGSLPAQGSLFDEDPASQSELEEVPRSRSRLRRP